jgi:photosynthetic reaction center H subunit
MQTGAITNYIDLAQLTLYAFWIFFAGLILYLRREDRREGYPLVTTGRGRRPEEKFPVLARPKLFRMPDGSVLTAPRKEAPEIFKGARTVSWEGAPIEPVGNPMLSGVGPAAYALRSEQPEMLFDGSAPVISPLRLVKGSSLDREDPAVIGMTVVGADGVAGGVVRDAWIDRVETLIRYLEVEVTTPLGPRHVLLPMTLAQVDNRRKVVKAVSVMGRHFADAPLTHNPDQVSLREEDQITAYFASGHLYAEPSRMGPIL